MKTSRQSRPPVLAPLPEFELAALRVRLAEAEETLRAIRTGEVDTVMVAGKQGSQVFTLEGAGDAYRVLIESMNEGALTLTADGLILYANRCFAKMVNLPLEKVVGGSVYRLLSAADQAALRPRLKRMSKSGDKIQVQLKARGGLKLSAQISLRRVARQGSSRATIGLVVTDMTETKRNEEMLRGLTHRVVRAQEAERGRVALELHDHITQLLCAAVFRSQGLVDQLRARDGLAKKEALALRGMLGHAVDEVERIGRNLRPHILEHLGLGAALRETCTEFAARTGLTVKLVCDPLLERLPAEMELSLYRILQIAFRNVEQHARARHVFVDLAIQSKFLVLVIRDDGIGFNPDSHAANRKGPGRLGLFGMRERAGYVGGAFNLTSAPRAGTEIAVRIPLSLAAVAPA